MNTETSIKNLTCELEGKEIHSYNMLKKAYCDLTMTLISYKSELFTFQHIYFPILTPYSSTFSIHSNPQQSSTENTNIFSFKRYFGFVGGRCEGAI